MTKPEKTLLRAWMWLMGLSLALAVAAEAARPTHLLLAWAALIGVVAYLKARIVLADYLGLRSAPGALSGFIAPIGAILATVVGSLAIEQALKLLR